MKLQPEKPASAGANSQPPDEKMKKERLRWADMLKRTFEIDVTVCPKCNGRLEQIAVIKDRVVAKAILESLNETTIFKPLKFVEVRGPPISAGPVFHNEFDQTESW